MEKKSQQSADKDQSVTEPELKSSLDFTKTQTDHVTVFIINFLGSMKFLLSCFIIFAVWICWNVSLLPLKPFDPFPFPILEMAVSLFAIILSVLVLINQNRQGRIETIRQQVEFEVNVRAEEEITKILNMVHELHQRMGINTTADQQLEEMKEPTDIKQIHRTIDDMESNENSKINLGE